MSGICGIRENNEGFSAGKWYVYPGCVGRQVNLFAVCNLCVDDSKVATLGTRAPRRSGPYKRRAREALESTRHCDAAIAGYRFRRGPMSICKDIFVVGPWMVDIRRGVISVGKRLLPSLASGFEDIGAYGRGLRRWFFALSYSGSKMWIRPAGGEGCVGRPGSHPPVSGARREVQRVI